MEMVQVINGQVKQTSLPKVGKLSTGQTVSNYHLLSETVLENEGWLPLEDNPPEYDPETKQLFEDGYEILETKVIKKYLIANYEAPETTEDRLDELQRVIDILLGGEDSE